MKLANKIVLIKVVAGVIVVAGLIFSSLFISIPRAEAAEVTGFFFSENSYFGNANVSDRFVNNANYIRLHGSIYSPEGEPEVTAKIWHTAGICLPGVIGDCQPGNLQIAEFNVPLVPDSRPDYYTFTNVSISGLIKPFTDGSWVGQLEIENEEQGIYLESSYSWFWLETHAPYLPELSFPALAGRVEEGDISFNWSDVMDYVPPSGLMSGLQGYFFELYTDDSLANKIYDSGLLNSSGATIAGLMSGDYYWRVRAIDNVGNVTNWTDLWHFSIYKPGEEPAEEPPPPPNDNPEDLRDNSDETEEATAETESAGTKAVSTIATTFAEDAANPSIAGAESDVSARAARVLGAFTEDVEAAEDAFKEEGEVKGITEAAAEDRCEESNFAWWLPLVLGFAITLLLVMFARPGKRTWLIVPVIIAILVQLGHWFWWSCNCATGPLCNWFWLFNVILLVISLLVYARKTRPYKALTK